MPSFIQVVTTPGAISKSTLSSVKETTVACRPNVVWRRSPGLQRLVQVDGGLHGALLATRYHIP